MLPAHSTLPKQGLAHKSHQNFQRYFINPSIYWGYQYVTNFMSLAQAYYMSLSEPSQQPPQQPRPMPAYPPPSLCMPIGTVETPPVVIPLQKKNIMLITDPDTKEEAKVSNADTCLSSEVLSMHQLHQLHHLHQPASVFSSNRTPSAHSRLLSASLPTATLTTIVTFSFKSISLFEPHHRPPISSYIGNLHSNPPLQATFPHPSFPTHFRIHIYSTHYHDNRCPLHRALQRLSPSPCSIYSVYL